MNRKIQATTLNKGTPTGSSFWWLSLQLLLIGLLVLTPLSVHAESAEHYISNASGGLQVGWVLDQETIVLVDDPNLIKSTFDQGWNHLRSTWGQSLSDFIGDRADQQEAAKVTFDWTTIDRTELAIKRVDSGAALKYILADNKVGITMHPSWSKWP